MTKAEQGHIDPQDPRYIHYVGRRLLRVAGGDGEEPGPAPWAQDLAALELPEEAVPVVDKYLRDTWQPRVTQLEQDRPPEAAVKLHQELEQNPEGVFNSFADSLFGEGAHERIAGLFEPGDPAATPPDPPLEDPSLLGDPALEGPEFEVDPDWEEVKEYTLDKKAEEVYQAEQARVTEAHPDLGDAIKRFGDEDFENYVIGADGDFDVAAERYLQKWGQLKDQFVPTPDDVPEPPPGEEPPPPALDGSGGPGAAPPTTKDYGSDLDAAIDDYFEEQKAAPPPPVGAS